MSKDGNLIDLADSALSGNVRIFGEIDPEWEVDPKSIVFQEKVRCLKIWLLLSGLLLGVELAVWETHPGQRFVSVNGCYTEHRPFGEPTRGSLGKATSHRNKMTNRTNRPVSVSKFSVQHSFPTASLAFVQHTRLQSMSAWTLRSCAVCCGMWDVGCVLCAS